MEKNPNLHGEKNSETPKLLRKLEKGDPNKSKIFHMAHSKKHWVSVCIRTIESKAKEKKRERLLLVIVNWAIWIKPSLKTKKNATFKKTTSKTQQSWRVTGAPRSIFTQKPNLKIYQRDAKDQHSCFSSRPFPVLSSWHPVASLSLGQEKEATAQTPLQVGRLRKDLHIEIKDLGPWAVTVLFR